MTAPEPPPYDPTRHVSDQLEEHLLAYEDWLRSAPPVPVRTIPPMTDAIVTEHMERGSIIAQLADEVLERRAEQRLLALVETAARAVLGAPEMRDGGALAFDGLYDAIEELDKHRAAKAPPRSP